MPWSHGHSEVQPLLPHLQNLAHIALPRLQPLNAAARSFHRRMLRQHLHAWLHASIVLRDGCAFLPMHYCLRNIYGRLIEHL